MKPSGSRSPDERSTCRRGRTYGGADAETRQEDRRTRIEESALDLFASRGYRHTTVSMICEHARVSRRHFYELFDDREAVLRHVYDLVQARTREAVLAAIGAHVREHGGRGDTTALVTAALDAYVAVLLEDPRGIRIGFVEVVGVSPDMEQHRLGNRREWAQLLQGAAVTAGAAHVPAWVYAAFIPSLNEFLMAWWQHSDDRSDPRELVQVLTAVLTTLMRQAVSGAG
ncbi:TetR/AcrR family transcriptional regulator [Tsukamurella paurometabola]|uniref:TetR/AcrR family transcriptional regulator n=1 Tax=Tsukamurella paurometabola TaxID=2061 RepID=UPI00019F0574|nr:TetR/AcrR family transcriptional regulator [Tsukamurella paurometabola]